MIIHRCGRSLMQIFLMSLLMFFQVHYYYFFQKMLLLTYIILAGVMSVAHAHYIKGLWFTSFPDSYSYLDYLRERH